MIFSSIASIFQFFALLLCGLFICFQGKYRGTRSVRKKFKGEVAKDDVFGCFDQLPDLLYCRQEGTRDDHPEVGKEVVYQADKGATTTMVR